ncbi:hypothetical protein VTO42DRAFT_826 [Malbranchea cinnamomea]
MQCTAESAWLLSFLATGFSQLHNHPQVDNRTGSRKKKMKRETEGEEGRDAVEEDSAGLGQKAVNMSNQSSEVAACDGQILRSSGWVRVPWQPRKAGAYWKRAEVRGCNGQP